MVPSRTVNVFDPFAPRKVAGSIKSATRPPGFPPSSARSLTELSGGLDGAENMRIWISEISYPSLLAPVLKLCAWMFATPALRTPTSVFDTSVVTVCAWAGAEASAANASRIRPIRAGPAQPGPRWRSPDMPPREAHARSPRWRRAAPARGEGKRHDSGGAMRAARSDPECPNCRVVSNPTAVRLPCRVLRPPQREAGFPCARTTPWRCCSLSP